MIAQDTGTAIVGPGRVDLFLGSGAEAGTLGGASAITGGSSCSLRAVRRRPCHEKAGPKCVGPCAPTPNGPKRGTPGRPRSRVTEEDLRLWAEVARSIKPLRGKAPPEVLAEAPPARKDQAASSARDPDPISRPRDRERPTTQALFTRRSRRSSAGSCTGCAEAGPLPAP